MSRSLAVLLLLTGSASADDGWPDGVTLGDIRDLPACTGKEPAPGPGELVTCRPSVLSGPVQWGMSVDWTTGIASGDVMTMGGAHALGTEVDFALARHLQLGARYELMGVGVSSQAGTGTSQHFIGQARYRLFTDEVDRAAFSLVAGGGFALRDDMLGGSGPLARVAIAREVGTSVGETSALTAAFELSYERVFSDRQLSLALASFRVGFETEVREPGNLGPHAPDAPPRFTTAIESYWAPTVGLGIGLGLPIAGPLSLETTASYNTSFTSDWKEQGFEGAAWAIESGPRIQGDWLYAQAQAGAAWIAHDGGGHLDAVTDGEFGVRVLRHCRIAADVGLRLRADLADGFDITGGEFVLRFAFGSRPEAIGGDACYRSEARVYAPPPPKPPEPAPVIPEPAPAVVAEPTPPPAPAPVVVVEPIVIDVDLGVEIAGVQIRIDPRRLPLDRLRDKHVTVELSGPADALAGVERSLRRHIHADVWRSVPTDGSTIHARFTIAP